MTTNADVMSQPESLNKGPDIGKDLKISHMRIVV